NCRSLPRRWIESPTQRPPIAELSPQEILRLSRNRAATNHQDTVRVSCGLETYQVDGFPLRSEIQRSSSSKFACRLYEQLRMLCEQRYRAPPVSRLTPAREELLGVPARTAYLW